MKHLALFLDGTANDPDDNTNVWRLRSMLADTDKQGNMQLFYYDKGVGTNWYDRIRGGTAGVGLLQNIREAYQWLVEHYDDGDAIYIFGFSRGAFTARSLAGMLSKCGLLVPGSPMSVGQIFDRYNSEDAKPIYRLSQDLSKYTKEEMEDKWVVEYSRRVPIRFIGLWDTVGALGFKIWYSRHEKRGEFNQHFVRLSNSFEHVYHALAIDEHRERFAPSLYYRFIPEKKPDKIHTPPPIVEQRWFVGAHANVGGGYRGDLLPQLPLKWIQSKAVLAGLNFRRLVILHSEEYKADVRDSFKEFFKGFYSKIKRGKRFYRRIGRSSEEVSKGFIEPYYETIDASVFDRWREDEKYRPPNLKQWADERNLDLVTVVGDRDARTLGKTSTGKETDQPTNN